MYGKGMKNWIVVLLFVTFGKAYAQSKAVETSGDILMLAIPASALASTLLYEEGNKGTWQFVKVYGTSFVVTQSLKRIIAKDRPEHNGTNAFPSGHSSNAFLGAAFIQRRYGWKVGLPAYALAAYTGWTRIDARKHDGWDVLGGAVIGIGSAYLFATPYEKKTQMDLTFSKTKEGCVVGFIYTF